MKIEEFVRELLEKNMEFSYEPDFLSLSNKFFFNKNVKLTIDEAIALSLKTETKLCHLARRKEQKGDGQYLLYSVYILQQ